MQESLRDSTKGERSHKGAQSYRSSFCVTFVPLWLVRLVTPTAACLKKPFAAKCIRGCEGGLRWNAKRGGRRRIGASTA